MSPRGRSHPVAHGEIATLLRKIRDDAGGTSGVEAGRRTGFSQAKVSRMERGQLVPTTRDLHEQHRAAVPARSTHLSVFHPLVIPGLLHTEEYVRAVFT